MENPELNYFYYSAFSLTGLSIIFCTWLIINCQKNEVKTLQTKIIQSIGVCNLLQNFIYIYYILNFFNAQLLTYLISLWFVTFTIASFIWSSLLSIYSYKRSISHQAFDEDKIYKKYLLIVVIAGFVYPILFIAAAYLLGRDSLFARIGLYVFVLPPLVLGIVTPFYFYCKSMKTLKKNYDSEFLSSFNVDYRRLIWYPVLLCITSIPISIALLWGDILNPQFYIILQLFYPLSGINNALLYLFVRNHTVARQLQSQSAQKRQKSMPRTSELPIVQMRPSSEQQLQQQQSISDAENNSLKSSLLQSEEDDSLERINKKMLQSALANG